MGMARTGFHDIDSLSLARSKPQTLQIESWSRMAGGSVGVGVGVGVGMGGGVGVSVGVGVGVGVGATTTTTTTTHAHTRARTHTHKHTHTHTHTHLGRSQWVRLGRRRVVAGCGGSAALQWLLDDVDTPHRQ